MQLLESHGLVPHACKTIKPGQRFGRLVALATGKVADTKKYRTVYRCDCGKVGIAHNGSLQAGTSRSCGCITRDRLTTHGHSGTPIYKAWEKMVSRCNKETDPAYAYYGSRGITVCEEWLDFNQFLQDMGPTHAKGLWLERCDNGKGYSPGNCRWATVSEQNRNKRSNINITLHGRTQVLMDWCKELGLPYPPVRARIRDLGWEPERALTTPLQLRR